MLSVWSEVCTFDPFATCRHRALTELICIAAACKECEARARIVSSRPADIWQDPEPARQLHEARYDAQGAQELHHAQHDLPPLLLTEMAQELD